jgi:hypothetical protein
MKATDPFETIFSLMNEMEAQGVIERYSVGGGRAVLFYTEPFFTRDLDFYVLFPQTDSPLIVLTPLYQFLAERGYQPKGEYVEIVGIPVQFVPANKLEEEAIREAIDISYGTTKARVPRPEHLVAIKLQVGRDRDVWHVHMLLEQTPIDDDYLRNILERHGLTEKWEAFRAGGR